MKKMIVMPEIAKIAGLNAKIKHLAGILENKMDTDGLDFQNAYFVNGCKEKNRHLYQGDSRLDRDGLVDNLYYCCQYTGYCEDDFYGTLYFKTNVPGQFVAVPFSM
jgi:hypothetical protein